MLRRIVSILILSLILFSVAGYYPAFLLEQKRVRKEIKHRLEAAIPVSELHKIVLARNSEKVAVNWIRPGKEFRLAASMYDVVRSDTTRDSISYFCINDKEEEELFANLDEMVDLQLADAKAPTRGSRKNLLKLFFSLSYFEHISLQLNSAYISVSQYKRQNTEYNSGYIRNFSPPPRQA